MSVAHQEVARAHRELRDGNPLRSFDTEGVGDVGRGSVVNQERVDLVFHPPRFLPESIRYRISSRLSLSSGDGRCAFGRRFIRRRSADAQESIASVFFFFFVPAFRHTSRGAPSARRGPSLGDASRAAGRRCSPPGRARTPVGASSPKRSTLPDCSGSGRWRLTLPGRSARWRDSRVYGHQCLRTPDHLLHGGGQGGACGQNPTNRLRGRTPGQQVDGRQTSNRVPAP